MSDTGRENDPFAAFESERTVIKPGAGRGAPRTATGSAHELAASLRDEVQRLVDRARSHWRAQDAVDLTP